MHRSSKDVKFIIYQSLYIFVVCVIAIKGANIDLTKVVEDNGKVIPQGFGYIDTVNNVIMDKTEFAKYVKFDSSRYVILDRNAYKQLEANKELPPPPPINLSAVNNYVPPPPEEQKPEENTIVNAVQVKFPSNFIQYKENTINNPNSVDLTVKTSQGTFTIPPRSAKAVLLGGDNTIMMTAGGKSSTFPVKENQRPRVDVQSINSGIGQEDVSIHKLESTVGYRVTITDDYADQLEYKITGPVTYKQVQRTPNQIVIDVTLNFLKSKGSFDNYQDAHPNLDRYTVTFGVNVKDKYAPHNENKIGVFNFTDW
jgi:hypothetical protein